MSQSVTKYLAALACASGLLATPARAAVTQLSFQPSPADLGDLDHHLVYSWNISNINLSNVSVTGASLTFKNIANWDSNPNMLFAWLMDTSTHPGVATVQDVDASQAPVTDIADAFLSPISLVANSTAKTKLFQKSFTTTPTTYTFNFNANQLSILQTYINNGHDIAFGFDPDCHFFNDGITFNIDCTPVPEVATMIPVAGFLALVVATEICRRRRLRLCPVRVS